MQSTQFYAGLQSVGATPAVIGYIQGWLDSGNLAINAKEVIDLSAGPAKDSVPVRRRRGRPAAVVAKDAETTAPKRARRSAAAPSSTGSMASVLKRIVDKPGLTTAQLTKAFPEIRPNHMGITLARLTRNGSITGTVKTGPWTATEAGAFVNAPAVPNLGQVRQRRGRPARATTKPTTDTNQQEPLQQTGT